MNQLSPHFTMAEMIFSEIALRKGLDNVPDQAITSNLVLLCTNILEPIRNILGVPIHINSGYRSVKVNKEVGSTAVHSAHIDGRAADFVPVGVSLLDAFSNLRSRLQGWDQLIIECNSWIHVSIPRAGEKPRREALIASGGPGKWAYEVAV